ncbi:mycoredoxin [Streptomyces sp. NPDC057271]|uniref:mycoredoxin n=1 Tax=unclassified Streptomyces TaxID=2593676 RepID=UPI00362DBE59
MPDSLPAPTALMVYWRPGCPYCAVLRRRLRRAGLAYEAVDIWQDEKAAAFVRSVNSGNETVPTVAVAGHTLTNPSVRQVTDLIRQHAPHLLPSPAQSPDARGRYRGWPWRRAE